MAQATLHIATFGSMKESIVSGIRNFPVHKMALIYYAHDKASANEFGRKISGTIGIPVVYLPVSEANVIRDVLQAVAQILTESNNADQILMNVSAGDKLLGCAALSAAFVNGIKAFGMDQDGSPILLPVLKLSYSEIVSDAKLGILSVIDKAGGSVESLESLAKISNYGKPLLSYHIQGARDSKGLAELGLVDVSRGERGKVAVKLTTLGKLLIVGDSKSKKR